MNVATFAYGDEVVQLSDIHYLPTQEASLSDIRAALLTLHGQGRLPVKMSPELMGSAASTLVLMAAYEDLYVPEFTSRANDDLNAEPVWIDEIDERVRTYFRKRRAVVQLDPLTLVPNLPHTGFGYIVEEGEFVEDIVRSFGLFRLQHVRQLGLLNAPAVGADGQDVAVSIYDHTRYLHSLDVCALITLMAHNNRLSESDRLHLQVAALTHDVLTPAGGDSVKRFDINLFDEDWGYPVLFTRDFWPALKQKYDLDEEKLHQIILGKGLLGRFLDLADKLAYVARDVDKFVGSVGFETPDGLNEKQATVRDLLVRDPHICGLWDSIKIVGDEVVVTDPHRLARFLYLRALMFTCLYYNPSARFHEDVTAGVFLKFAYDQGALPRDVLLHETDEYVYNALDVLLGTTGLLHQMNNPLDPHVETFTTRTDALARERKLAKTPKILTHLVERKSYTNSGVENFKVLDAGQVKTLKEVCPKDVARIGDMMTAPRPVWLYYFSTEHVKLPFKLVAKLRHERRRRLS